MKRQSTCRKCGVPLTAQAREGICPKCLLEQALVDQTGGESAEAALESEPVIAEGPGTVIGRYKLLEKIGEGGFGVVYMAEQEEPVRRRVALKIIKLGMDTKEVVARFEAERQALALMDHPNIARVFDGGATDTGRPYFVMELVRGVRITEYCDQKRLSPRQRLELFMQVCQAVQHAHQKGIIHRDLKPSNILVTVNDGVPVPKVIDFGIAKATGMRLTDKTLFTRFLHLLGTPAYMSPEQVEMTSVDVDTRSDIYSLGVLLYELLTGKTPLDSQQLLEAGVDEMRRRIRNEEPPKPSTRLSTLTDAERTTAGECRSVEGLKLIHLVRGDLDWIAMKCLEKERARRYETASGLAADLQRYLNDEPVVAGPPTARYRARKFLRKHRKAVAVTAGFAGLLSVASVVSTGLALWANQQRVRADRLAKEQSTARTEADSQRKRAFALLNQMQIQRAEDYFGADDSARAVAQLASVLRRDPSNYVAAARLHSALTYRNFALPSMEPLRHEQRVQSAQFSPDGLWVVTACADGTARVWDAQSGRALAEPLRHDGPVWSAQFSPDGLWVITASDDRTARVWDARSGRALTEPLRHDGPVRSAQFSPDGLRVVTASDDKTARVWNAQTGGPLTGPLRHEEPVGSAQFSPDGLLVVTASGDISALSEGESYAQVWDAKTGQRLTKLRHEYQVLSAQFSPDGQWVVTASGESARVWDARTGQPLSEPLQHGSIVDSARFSPDGLRVVTASWDETARVWDARTGQPLTEPLRHEGLVSSAQFSPDGLRIVTASWDKTARVWDARTGQPLTEPLRHERLVSSAQFSPDGLRVVTASDDKTAGVWDARIGQALTEPLRHGAVVTSAQFSPDGRRVVTASWDETARVWDARTSQPLTEPFRHEGIVRSAQFSPDGRQVLTCSGKVARVWDAQTGQPITEPLRHDAGVTSARFSPDGRWVVTASSDKSARVWDVKAGQPVGEPLRHEGIVMSARFSPDGRRVVTASMDQSARLWDAQSGGPVSEPLRHEGPVLSAQFSPDGQWVVTASWDATARVWDAQIGQPVSEPLRHGEVILSAQFSPDGRQVVTASSDATARVWDAQTGQPITEPLRHEGSVRSARFSPDGRWVVTACGQADGNAGYARVWDAQTGQPITEPLRHEGAVRSVRFSPDGRWVVTASDDKTGRVWAVSFGPMPVWPWFPELAESIVGKRLTGTVAFKPVGAEEFLKLKEHLLSSTESNYDARLAKWFLGNRAARTISLLSRTTVPEYLQLRIQENTLESLHEAVRLSPTNGLAFARLAKQVLAQSDEDNPRRVGEADFFSHYALKWSPNDPEVTKIRAVIAVQVEHLRNTRSDETTGDEKPKNETNPGR